MKRRLTLLAAALLLLLGAALLTGCGSGDSVITSAADLNGRTVALYTDSMVYHVLVSDYPEIRTLSMTSVSDMLLALRQNKIDAFCMDRPSAAALQKTEGGIAILDEGICQCHSVAYFSDSDQSDTLREQFNAMLADLESDGTLAELEEKWFYGEEEPEGLDFSTLTGENGTVRVGLGCDNYPHLYLAGEKPAGYEAELLYRFCERYGYAAELHCVSWDAMATGTATGLYEIGFGNIMYSGEYSSGVKPSEPLCEYDIVFIVRDGSEEETEPLADRIRDGFTKTFVTEDRWKLIARGLGATAGLTALAVALGSVFGFAFYMVCRKGGRAARLAENAYLAIVQKLPSVLLLMIFCYVLFRNSSVPMFLISVFAFAFLFGADVLSALKTAVGAIDPGQRRAALALGYTERQAFYRLLMPQAMGLFLPAWRDGILALLKATAIVGYVAVQDLTMAANLIRARTFEPFLSLIAVAIVYFLLAWLLQWLAGRIICAADTRRRSERRILKGVKRDD